MKADIKADINSKGRLMIYRIGSPKIQFCPYCFDVFCGDWCPRFVETRRSYDSRPMVVLNCGTELMPYEIVHDDCNKD